MLTQARPSSASFGTPNPNKYALPRRNWAGAKPWSYRIGLQFRTHLLHSENFDHIGTREVVGSARPTLQRRVAEMEHDAEIRIALLLQRAQAHHGICDERRRSRIGFPIDKNGIAQKFVHHPARCLDDLPGLPQPPADFLSERIGVELAAQRRVALDIEHKQPTRLPRPNFDRFRRLTGRERRFGTARFRRAPKRKILPENADRVPILETRRESDPAGVAKRAVGATEIGQPILGAQIRLLAVDESMATRCAWRLQTDGVHRGTPEVTVALKTDLVPSGGFNPSIHRVGAKGHEASIPPRPMQ